MDQHVRVVAQLRTQLTKYEFLGLFEQETTNEEDRAILRRLAVDALAEMGAIVARSLQGSSVHQEQTSSDPNRE